MKGEIDVTAVMQQHHRLKEWQARRARDVEWIALKEYWRADREDRYRVVDLYGEVLMRAYRKYYRRETPVDRQPQY